MIKRLLQTSLAMLFTLLVWAEPVNIETAREQAAEFFNRHSSVQGKRRAASAQNIRLLHVLRHTPDEEPLLYVFGQEDGEGYAIIAGDDNATAAILGYSETGTFNAKNMPCCLSFWLDEYGTQLEAARKKSPSFKTATTTVTATTTKKSIAPLITTKWDQGEPYNLNCPDFFGQGKCITGCEATALAQVMYYHRKRSITQTTATIPAYICEREWVIDSKTCHISVDAIPRGAIIDWDNMIDKYDGTETATQKQAVANLMKYCGAAIQMDYATGQSDAHMSNIPIGLKKYFNYSSNTELIWRDYLSNQEHLYLYSDEEWENLIYNELSNNRPVLYHGMHSTEGTDGHVFVCDGYDGNGYYHINWGWGGYSDGYFLLSALDQLYPLWHAALINAVPKDGIDLTDLVGTSAEDWNAGGMVGWAAPTVTTRDGRQTALAERYEETVENTGVVMEQTIEDLEDGAYKVKLFANAYYTNGRGFSSNITDGQMGIVYLSANDTRVYIPAHIGTEVSQNDEYTLTCNVTEGTLHLGMTAEKSGTNWHSIQIKSLDRIGDIIDESPITVTANNLSMVYGDDVPTLTYRAEGAALNGTPSLSTTATKTSDAGTYPITVEVGTVTSKNVTYVEGTLTITKAPLTVGVEDVTIIEGDAIPTFTLTYSGWKNGDTEACAFSTKPTASTTINTSSIAGNYPITVSGGKAPNYDISYTKGILSILKKEVPQPTIDLTTKVGTTEEDWNADGMVSWAGPMVTTRDGRETALAEMYEETTENKGTVLKQTITVLENGVYEVTLFANAFFTNGRGFVSDITDNQMDVVYLFANEAKQYIPAHIGTEVSEHGIYTLICNVTDGELRLGMTAEKAGTNWHSIQIKSLDRIGEVNDVDSLTIRQTGDSDIFYDLTGRRWKGKPSSKGIYIKDGKKVEVK